jgi:hypothetical protein
LSDDGFEFGEVIDDVAVSLDHLLQLVTEDVRFVGAAEMFFERSNEFGKRGHRWCTATDRGDVPKFGGFGEERSCYFDFTAFVFGIIDVIFGSYGPRVDGGKRQVFTSENGGLVELSVGRHFGQRTVRGRQ